MTDNDIIKALECCVNNGRCKECPINPHYGNYGYCTNLALTHALELINRQKAEIERLRGMVAQNEGVLPKYERLVKTEAIKEFAERLKETDGYNNHIFDDCARILVSKEYAKGRDEKIKEMLNTIDNLVKEMTEGEDES